MRLDNPRGNRTVTIASVVVTGSNFLIDPASSNTCIHGTMVPAGGRCEIGVYYKPAEQGGPSTGTLTVTDNSANSPHTTQLTGGGGR